MKKALLASIATLAITACATSYQKEGFSGGFNETRIAPNAWKVTFAGNGYTSRTKAEDFTLLRSADLTLQSGFQYFAIVGSNSDISTVSSWTAPTTSTTNMTANRFGNSATGTATTTTSGGNTFLISKPSSSNTIVMFKAEPQGRGMIYDASFLCDSMGGKYGIKCGSVK